jgi:ubiquitin-like modifier-activating enzyme ATG7
MLLKAFNDADHLEKITGLDELHRESEKAMADVEWSEGSDEDF